MLLAMIKPVFLTGYEICKNKPFVNLAEVHNALNNFFSFLHCWKAFEYIFGSKKRNIIFENVWDSL